MRVLYCVGCSVAGMADPCIDDPLDRLFQTSVSGYS